MPRYLPEPASANPPPQWLVRLLSVLAAVVVLVVAVFLGGVILVTGAVLGVGLWLWLWWQRRKMARAMARDGVDPAGLAGLWSKAAGFDAQRGRPAGRPGRDTADNIIEGDFEVVDDRRRSEHERRPR